jgi:hypothetical protein
MNEQTEANRGRRIAKKTLAAIVFAVVSFTVIVAPAAAGSTKRVGIEMLATQSVVAGQSARFAFLLTVGDRPMTIFISGLAAGVEAEIVPGGNDRYDLVLYTSVDSPRGYFTVLIRARIANKVVSKAMYLEISEPVGASTLSLGTRRSRLAD